MNRTIVIAFLIFVIATSCEQAYSPKPRGYFRIELPEKKYQSFDTTFPYTFDYPVYAEIVPDLHSPNEKNLINLNYLPFNATLYISYKHVDGNLIQYLEDAHKMVIKHIPKVDAIYDSLILDRDRNMYGLIYQLEGSGAATPYQFFLTDSLSHFVRGALYFNTAPNNDSLEPVIDFITEDINYMINSFRWKDQRND